MNENSNGKKLDWMYKGANSMVDREEYLLGRSVDKALEQLNAEEKEKKLGLVPPKNHVEHECIPPSIRDFNKIVQAEQVDISAKLQEDPLVAIKKREEEARRQFLQNPVQLKKLQEALKAQQLKKKKKKHKKSKSSGSDSDLDNKIAKKLKYLKEEDTLVASSSKKQKRKSKDRILDTILMHKFNQLKDRLSQEDLNDILTGNTSDCDEEKTKKHKKKRETSSEESDEETKPKRKEKRRTNSTSSEEEKPKRTRKWSSSSSSSKDEDYSKGKHKEKGDKDSYRKNGKDFSQERRKEKGMAHRRDTDYKRTGSRSIKRNQRKHSTSSDEAVENYTGKSLKNYREEKETQWKNSSENNKERNLAGKESEKKYIDKHKDDLESDLESKILKKLRMLRDSVKSKAKESSSDNDDTESEHRKRKKTMDIKNKKESTNSSDSSSGDSDSANRRSQKPLHQYDSDSDEQKHKPRAFGLVKSDGTKIALNKKPYEVKKADKSTAKMEVVSKSERKNVKKLTEEEKDKLRREMTRNAEKREKERSDNLKRYREEDKREEREAAKFDKGFVHKELLKSTKDATVETRIKSNLNNIQRSSRHMDSSFSRRK